MSWPKMQRVGRILPLKVVVVVVEEDKGGTEVWHYINTRNEHIINQWFI